MALQLVAVIVFGMFPILFNCEPGKAIPSQPQQEEKRNEKDQEPQAVPEAVLKDLRANFEKLEANMCDEEIFRTLGLSDYQNDLQKNSRFLADGAGGDWRYFIDDQNGYSLAFRSFLGVYTECYLKLPGEKNALGFDHWRVKRVDAKLVRPTYAELNRKRTNNR